MTQEERERVISEKVIGITLEKITDMTREEAIAYFKDMNECTYGDVEPIQMAIQALEQEPREHGEWERGYSYPDGQYVKCSVCGEIIKCTYPMHFCPNCGADMRKGKKNV